MELFHNMMTKCETIIELWMKSMANVTAIEYRLYKMQTLHKERILSGSNWSNFDKVNFKVNFRK